MCFGQLIFILEFKEKLLLVDFECGPALVAAATKAQALHRMLGRQ